MKCCCTNDCLNIIQFLSYTVTSILVNMSCICKYIAYVERRCDVVFTKLTYPTQCLSCLSVLLSQARHYHDDAFTHCYNSVAIAANLEVCSVRRGLFISIKSADSGVSSSLWDSLRLKETAPVCGPGQCHIQKLVSLLYTEICSILESLPLHNTKETVTMCEGIALSFASVYCQTWKIDQYFQDGSISLTYYV